jgi:hypothetical protein
MSTPNPFSQQFGRLLAELSGNPSLAEWQFLYRQVIVSMGMEILERFEQVAVGPDPSSSLTAAAQSPAAQQQQGQGKSPPPVDPPKRAHNDGHRGGVQPGPSGGHGGGPEQPLPAGHGGGYQPVLFIASAALGLGGP